MEPRYLYKDKNPMGTYLSYRLLPQLFKGKIVVPNVPLGEYCKPWPEVANTAYLLICHSVMLNEEEKNNVLQYVQNGNELLIVAEAIDEELLKSLSIQLVEKQTIPLKDTRFLPKKDTYFSLRETQSGQPKQYGFFYYPQNNYFKAADNDAAFETLGFSKEGRPNFIALHYGKGNIFLHAAPASFSNYFLLTNNNINYYKKVLSYLNEADTTIYWGNHFFPKKNNTQNTSNNFSALSLIWKNPPLFFAFLLACLLMLLYVAFNSKRKHPLVKPLASNSNATVAFVKTISNVYLQRKDNRNIALKIITYFFEHIRTHYYVATGQIDEAFIQVLARKSGIAENKVIELMTLVDSINKGFIPNDIQLFDLKKRIQAFHTTL
jgi:hypothetical protein